MVCSTKITTCFRLSNLRLWNLEKLITSALRKPRARAPAITCPATSPATSSECTTVNGSDRRDGTSEPPRVSAGPGRSTVVGSGGLPIAPVDCLTSSLACTASAIARAVSSYSVFCGTRYGRARVRCCARRPAPVCWCSPTPSRDLRLHLSSARQRHTSRRHHGQLYRRAAAAGGTGPQPRLGNETAAALSCRRRRRPSFFHPLPACQPLSTPWI